MNWNWFGKTLKQRKQLNHNILTALTTIIVVSMWWIWEHQQCSKENTSQLSKHNDNGFWWVCLKMLKKKKWLKHSKLDHQSTGLMTLILTLHQSRPLHMKENSALISIVFFPIWATCLVNNIYFILKVES